MDEKQANIMNNEGQMVPAGGIVCDKEVDNEISINVNHVGYTLNKKSTIDKKILSCSRRPYDFKMKSGNYVGELSTAAFELFRGDIDTYLRGKKEYIIKVTETKDRAGKTTQDAIRVKENPGVKEFNFDDLPLLYTVNMWRTKDKVMVNGSAVRKFIDEDLPNMTANIDNVSDLLEGANSHYKKCLELRYLNFH